MCSCWYGFLLGSSIIFIMFTLDDTIKQKKDVVEKIKLNVLGELPKLNEKSLKHQLLVVNEPKSMFSESVRNIRSNVKFLMFDKNLKLF